ncbi:hypothetical protein DSO57_1021073 [Entomophthora muscae]|uniref:Uncharacterized protein n=1 Tax=Entomophthora muscae TaxID=34485 RepID=A0ACC2SSE9_9FUNG|nr:hypothetical protein DSO57_1021073 [Entomophthora muscae]
MSAGILHGPKGNPRVHKVLITAKLSSIPIDHDQTFELGKDNKTPDYLAKFPLGQVPAFEIKDGPVLTESNAIAFYVASLKENNPLLGKGKDELAKIYQYSFMVETQVVSQAVNILLPNWGKLPYDETLVNGAYEKLESMFEYLNKEIAGKKYLVGDHLTLADIFVCANLNFIYKYILIEEKRNKVPNLTNYYLAYRAIPEIKELEGEVQLALSQPKPGDKMH